MVEFGDGYVVNGGWLLLQRMESHVFMTNDYSLSHFVQIVVKTVNAVEKFILVMWSYVYVCLFIRFSFCGENHFSFFNVHKYFDAWLNMFLIHSLFIHSKAIYNIISHDFP